MTACMDHPPFETVAAVIVDARGRVLLVRKRGSGAFIHPGGKREPGEEPLQTLAREVQEELAVDLVPGSAELLGIFEDRAVNEPGRRVRAMAYRVGVIGVPCASSEIEELAWVDAEPPFAVDVAPLSARHILPAHRRGRGVATVSGLAPHSPPVGSP